MDQAYKNKDVEKNIEKRKHYLIQIAEYHNDIVINMALISLVKKGLHLNEQTIVTYY